MKKECSLSTELTDKSRSGKDKIPNRRPKSS